jgi:hypothetical protein
MEHGSVILDVVLVTPLTFDVFTLSGRCAGLLIGRISCTDYPAYENKRRVGLMESLQYQVCVL